MRNKKNKLLAFSVLALCVACLAFGVYALKNATLTVNGTVGFTAHDCLVYVVAEIEGDGVAVDANGTVTPNNHGEPSAKRDLIINETENSNEMLVGGASESEWEKVAPVGAIYFTDLTDSGEVAQIKMTFTLTNQSAYSVVASISNEQFDLANIIVGASEDITLEKGATGTLTATFDLEANDNGEYPDVNNLPFEVKLDFRKTSVQLETPQVNSVNLGTKQVAISAVEGATSYRVDYFNESDEIVATETIPADQIENYTLTNVPVANGTYTVKLVAVGNKIDASDSDYVVLGSIKVSEPTTASYFEFSGNKVLKYVGPSDMDIVIPRSYDIDAEGNFIDGDKYQVTQIGQDYGNGITRVFTTLEGSVTVLDNITTITQYSFESAPGVTALYLPSTITSIGTDFDDCTNLKGVYIEDLTSWFNISFRANQYSPLAGCSNPLVKAGNLYLNNELLTDLVIPEGITTLNPAAFAGCNMTSVTLPSTLTKIEKNMFDRCKKLETVKLSEGIEEIGTDVFYGCSSLNSINIPSTLSSVGNDAFRSCSKLKNIYIKDLKQVLSDIVYSNASSYPLYNDGKGSQGNVYLNEQLIEDLVIPGTIKDVNKFFYGSTIKSITIEDGVETIGNGAFERCSSLKTVTMANSVTSLGGSAFNACSQLTDVKLSNQILTIESYTFNSTNVRRLEIPNGFVELSNSAFGSFSNSTYITLIIPSDVETIIETFDHYESMTTAYIYTPASREFTITHLKTIYVPTENYADFVASEFWSQYTIYEIQ